MGGVRILAKLPQTVVFYLFASHSIFMSPEQPQTATADASPAEVTIESVLEHAKRAFALRKYEQAVDHYATVLELMTKRCGENAPEMADLYFSYGKALLENAISQNSVLGKEQPEEGLEDANQVASGSGASGSGPILSFSGDAEEPEEDLTVDLFEQAAQSVAEADAAAAEHEEDEAEPEDDFNAAWEVLDLARAIYDKTADDDEEVQLKLADTYIALGDVSLETEKFDQAIADYTSGLELKTKLLPTSSRQLAEAHYKLSIVLDLTSGRLADAINHAEKALESVESRLSELQAGLAQEYYMRSEKAPNDKDKGKTTGTRLVRDDLAGNMPKPKIEAEIKELSELKEDLALKVEELKTSPSESIGVTAPALAAQALDKELNAGSRTLLPEAPVNDLTSMVIKKKKPPVTEATGSKRRADNEPADSPGSEKKAKLETEMSS